MFTRKIPVLVASMGLVLCTSCGGGGGGGVAPPPPAPPPNPMALPITGDNAQDITEVVLESVIASVEIIDLVDVVGLPAFGSSNQGIPKLVVRDIFVEVVPCDTGEATITWNDADDNLDLSTGDTLDAVFDMCFFADTGTTLDGAMSFTNLVVVGDPDFVTAPWQFAITFSFDNLSGTDSSGTATIDGSLNIDMASDDNIVIDLSVGTSSLTAQESGISATLSDYLLTQTIDLNTLMQTINADGVLTSTELEGSVTFETMQDFVIIADDNPSSGQILIADANSSVLVTVLDNMSVQLEIDLTRDGTIDQTIQVLTRRGFLCAV
jgi:hypothetical protein